MALFWPRRLWHCFVGPRLYRIHKHGAYAEGQQYEQNFVEKASDTVIHWIKFCYHLSYWTSPVLLVILYRRGWFTAAGLVSSAKFAVTVSSVLIVASFFRGIGRFFNARYATFLAELETAKTASRQEKKMFLSKYDFAFHAWPADFSWKEATGGDGSKREKVTTPHHSRPRGIADKIKALPCQVLSYIAAHTFGHRMMYPGSTALIQALMGPMLLQARTKLLEEKSGVRAKLKSEDGCEIDTMFVDRRNSLIHPEGNTLIICSEGNSGFYEVGCTVTPLDAGYSVLGWNHPGFGGSTGVPFPWHEQNAIDVVIQYAIQRLGFQPENIGLFAWSIGGYPATWAAMNYPDIKFVILDATFDDITPLATARMPQSWKGLVLTTVKKYLNLNNAEQLCRYPGPVLLIRRTKDEMITTIDPQTLASNRGNDLLVKLLQYRYPKIVDESTMSVLRDWLAVDRTGQVELWSQHGVDDDVCGSYLHSYVEEHSNSFPMQLGEEMTLDLKIQLTLYLASKYLDEFNSTHCTPLPAPLFRQPWTVDM